jgi:hypothetical protein
MRTAPKRHVTINRLIAAANKNDRFKLLEDDSIPASNLDIAIHPVFGRLDCDGPMNQTLRLASHFLAHDSVLAFFVPLVYGRELTSTDNSTRKRYLSNPFTNASDSRRQELLSGVRQALCQMAHIIRYEWYDGPRERVWARTLVDPVQPVHTSSCCSTFQRRNGAMIELNISFQKFYNDKDGYARSSRCAQFRHDFLFASTVVHEMVHAVGVLRRGHTREPFIRPDYFEDEWGWAWEHFMFGCIINPQDRARPGTHILMRKLWAASAIAEAAGGKQYCDVPMSYVAQWFREETWTLIAKRGPTDIFLPVTRFKVQHCDRKTAWLVSTDNPEVAQDVVTYHKQRVHRSPRFDAWGYPVPDPNRVSVRIQSTERLQRSNVRTVLRAPPVAPRYLTCVPQPMVSKVQRVNVPVVSAADHLSAEDPTASLSVLGVSRKRHADEETEEVRATKIIKL